MRNSSIKYIPATFCAGHFDGSPALPIAFLATFCVDLSGKAIGVLAKKRIAFDKECAGPGKMKDVNDTRPSLKCLSAKVDAFRLVCADTHGISLLCKVEKQDNEEDKESKLMNVYSSEVTVVAVSSEGGDEENPDGTVIAKVKVIFELHG